MNTGRFATITWHVLQLLGLVALATGAIVLIVFLVTTPSRHEHECLGMMRMIDSGKESYALGWKLADNTVLTTNQIQILGSFLRNGWSGNRCPSGGTYDIGAIGKDPRCSIHGSLSELITKQRKK
jgi:hypothetical protein